jgi:predicted GH43/DUF377 family glycosyl hydrolase
MILVTIPDIAWTYLILLNAARYNTADNNAVLQCWPDALIAAVFNAAVNNASSYLLMLMRIAGHDAHRGPIIAAVFNAALLIFTDG